MMREPGVTPGHRRIPPWLMGLANVSFGLYGGAVAFAIPQLLGQRQVPEGAIAGLTAVAFSPGFWAFLFSPILDVRFSRRTYAIALAAVTALAIFVGFLNLDHLMLLEIVLTAGGFASFLYQSALGGWLSSIASAEEEKTISVWMTIGNTGGFSIMAIGCNQLASRLSPMTTALVLGASILAPVLAFPFMPAPGPDRRLASESFSRFFGEVVSLLRRREVLIAILLFAAPAATFSLTNFLGGRGSDFHASPGFVGLVGGIAAAAGGAAGCLVFPAFSRLSRLRPLYLSVGVVGSLFTLGFILLPHIPASFAVILVMENFFQCLAITTSTAITFEIIGRGNPLAATTFCLVTSAFCLPISYVLYVDAYGYARGGIGGSLAIDALTGLLACIVLGILLAWLARRSRALALSAGAKR